MGTQSTDTRTAHRPLRIHSLPPTVTLTGARRAADTETRTTAIRTLSLLTGIPTEEKHAMVTAVEAVGTEAVATGTEAVTAMLKAGVTRTEAVTDMLMETNHRCSRWVHLCPMARWPWNSCC